MCRLRLCEYEEFFGVSGVCIYEDVLKIGILYLLGGCKMTVVGVMVLGI